MNPLQIFRRKNFKIIKETLEEKGYYISSLGLITASKDDDEVLGEIAKRNLELFKNRVKISSNPYNPLEDEGYDQYGAKIDGLIRLLENKKIQYDLLR